MLTLGRMRGQISDWARCTQGSISPLRRRVTFPAMGKSPKDRRGTPQRRTPFANDGLPPVPHYGGYPLGWTESFRRTKFEWVSKSPPGHWALGLQKFTPLRFIFCAWLCRANAPGLFSAVGAALAAARREGTVSPVGAAHWAARLCQGFSSGLCPRRQSLGCKFLTGRSCPASRN